MDLRQNSAVTGQRSGKWHPGILLTPFPGRNHLSALLLLFLSALGCESSDPRQSISDDEPLRRALVEQTRIETAAKDNFYPKRVYDYFHDMDSVSATGAAEPDQLLDLRESGEGETATPEVKLENREVKPPKLTHSETLGRNTWMMWCAGNESFWDYLAVDSLGFIDLLKLVDSRNRNERFKTGGLINEPEMASAAGPGDDEFGLWLDTPRDPRIREWRKAYVTKTFAAIAEGRHKSQVGLKVRSRFYDRETEKDLYRGDPQAFSGKGYDYPSSYLPNGDYDDSSNGDYGYKSNFYDENIPPPDIYGLSSGVIGLRLFPNPNFDAEAQKRWDAKRFYSEDRSYWSDPNLIRPYRVGVSCAYCHASYHPLTPPKSLADPEWANLSGSIGAQYLRIRVAFGNLLTKDQFTYHLLDSQPPGTIDTSLIASDNINNPNTMNAIFNLGQRSFLSFRNPRERQAPVSKGLPSYFPGPDPGKPSAREYPGYEPERDWRPIFAAQGLKNELAESNGDPRHVPRVLFDGADSIGAWGALARVYLNIGSFSERWIQLHEPVIGFRDQYPFRIRDCESHSVYWNATTLRVEGLRDYFLKVTPPMPLLSTLDAEKRIKPIDISQLGSDAKPEDRSAAKKLQRIRKVDVERLAHGRKVFAENCIVCHSSIQPESSAVTLYPFPADADSTKPTAEQRDYEKDYSELIQRRKSERDEDAEEGKFFERDPGGWLSDPAYQKWALEIVNKPEFWKNNYLSTDYRVPITLVKTNSGRAMATNALTGHLWEDFASESYRTLPAPGSIKYFNPYKGEKGGVDDFMPRHKTPPGVPEAGGGVGYYRVPTLISVWATAPFLHNNSLGVFNNDPSVEGRLEAFDDGIRKLLWPEKRLESSSYNEATPARLQADQGLIWRTTEDTTLTIDAKRVPFFATRVPFVAKLYEKYPWLREVTPLWAPSAVLLFGSLLILVLSKSRRAGAAGLILLVAAAGWFVLSMFANTYPEVRLLDSVRAIQPSWLLSLVLLALAIPLLLPLSASRRRTAGYLATVASLVFGGIVYFNAGKLGALNIGPIPKGTPVNLLANFNPDLDRSKQIQSLKQALDGFAEIKSRNLQEADAQRVMREKIAPALMDANKCPDFVMDKGHYYDWFDSMTDEDKEALIELLKTF